MSTPYCFVEDLGKFWEMSLVPVLALLHICGSFSVTNKSTRNKQPSINLFYLLLSLNHECRLIESDAYAAAQLHSCTGALSTSGPCQPPARMFLPP